MADNIEGLPEGAIVGEPLQTSEDQPQITGLPEGAVVGKPFKASTAAPVGDAPKEETPKENPSVLSTITGALMNKPGPSGGPGMWTRAAQAVGMPTTREEAEAAKPSVAEQIIGPAATAGKMVYGTAKQGEKGRAEGGQEIKEAAQNIWHGQPIMRNIGKAAYGATHAALQTIPFVGPPTETMGEDIANKNYRGAVGSGIGMLPMLLGGEEGKSVEGHTPEEIKNLKILQDHVVKAEKAHAPNKQLYDAHEADRQAGNPAPEAVLKPYEKTKRAAEDAKRALQAHQKAMAAKPVPAAAPEVPLAQRSDLLTTEQQAAQAARTAKPPTDAELKTRQEKLMGQMEKHVGIEPPAPTPANVKLPGQIQPETFPQTPTERPVVPEARMPLAGSQGTMGRQRMLTAGTPEAPAVAEAPVAEAPVEAPAPTRERMVAPKPGRMGTLKAEGGKIVDKETPLQQKIEEGLQGTAKPVAIPPKTTNIPEAPLIVPEDLGLKGTDVRGRVYEPEAPKAEAPKAEAPKETSPEDMTKTEAKENSPENRTAAEHTVNELPNQELQNLGAKHGLSTSTKDYDFSKREPLREGGSNHPVDRSRFHKDLMDKLPAGLVDKISEVSKTWDEEHPHTFDSASRSSKWRADRAKEIVFKATEDYEDEKNTKENPNIVYRARSKGDIGVPVAEHAQAQATDSLAQAKKYAEENQRTSEEGEVVKINLKDLDPKDYEITKHPNGQSWVKFKRPLTEKEVALYDADGVVEPEVDVEKEDAEHKKSKKVKNEEPKPKEVTPPNASGAWSLWDN
jgi:hypothetical protein